MDIRARPIDDVARDLNEFLLAYPGNQDEIAVRAGVHQSTVCRAIHATQRLRISAGLKKLCIFANIPLLLPHNLITPNPSANSELMEALAEVWDGSPSHAKALARIIRDLQHISKRRS